MIARRTSLYCLLIVLACQLSAEAENSGDYAWPTDYYQPVSPLPPHMLESYHHDSTATGNMLRGWASVLHADGSWRLNVSQAAILGETAEAVAHYNRCQWIAFRQANRQRLAHARQQQIDARRLKNDATRDARLAAAYALLPGQLDRNNGTITWPDALQAYPDSCSQLAGLYSTYLANRDSASAHELTVQIESLRRTVRADIARHSNSDYSTAQKFLCGLKVEVTKPAAPLAALTSYAR